MQISRTGLSCLLHPKAYVTYLAGATFGKREVVPDSCRAAAGRLQPVPTPPPPAEALKFPGRKPQKVSAFALTYILLRRSCKLRVLLSFTLASLGLRELQTAGPLRSTDITPLHRYYEPIRNPLVFHRFPGFASYTVCCSADFSAGRGGLLQLLSASLSSCCR